MNNIRIIRRLKNIRASDIASKLNMSIHNFYRLETGKLELKQKHVNILCPLLECTVKELSQNAAYINKISNLEYFRAKKIVSQYLAENSGYEVNSPDWLILKVAHFYNTSKEELLKVTKIHKYSHRRWLLFRALTDIANEIPFSIAEILGVSKDTVKYGLANFDTVHNLKDEYTKFLNFIKNGTN